MIKNWEKQLDNGEKVEVIFMNFSKAFGTTNHSLLMAKLKANDSSDQVYFKVTFPTDFRKA